MIVLTPKTKAMPRGRQVWFGNVPTLRRLADRLSVKAITTVSAQPT
jgi:hypothetical protein